MRKIEDLDRLIGNTPLVEITYEYNGDTRKTLAKCEWYNLSGSIKDRVAYQIIKDAITSGKVNSKTNIVEVSSGNMGISLSAISAYLGLNITIIMPRSMSQERKELIKMYGARLIETKDFAEAFALCDKLVEQGYYCTRQFSNPSNTKTHSTTTANEILELVTPDYTSFVAGVGTSGTLSGVSSILREAGISTIAIEPYNARILTSDPPYSHHELQGLSDEILPELYSSKLVDNIIPITDDDAITMSQKLCKELGLGVGISSGANFLGCVLSNNNAITIFPDDNKKYLTTRLAKTIHTPLVDSINLIALRSIQNTKSNTI